MFLRTISWKVCVIKRIVYWAILMKVKDSYFSFLEEMFKHVFGLYLELSSRVLDLRSASPPCALDVPTISLSHLVTNPWVSLSPQYILKPPHTHTHIDVGFCAILGITFRERVNIQCYRVALQSFSAVHPSSVLFYNKNPYNCIFTCVLLTYCEMCWQWCIKHKNSWK